jgi:hypothetical protein
VSFGAAEIAVHVCFVIGVVFYVCAFVFYDLCLYVVLFLSKPIKKNRFVIIVVVVVVVVVVGVGGGGGGVVIDSVLWCLWLV